MYLYRTNKQITSLVVSIKARDVRRRVAAAVGRVHIRALLDQQLRMWAGVGFSDTLC